VPARQKTGVKGNIMVCETKESIGGKGLENEGKGGFSKEKGQKWKRYQRRRPPGDKSFGAKKIQTEDLKGGETCCTEGGGFP